MLPAWHARNVAVGALVLLGSEGAAWGRAGPQCPLLCAELEAEGCPEGCPGHEAWLSGRRMASYPLTSPANKRHLTVFLFSVMAFWFPLTGFNHCQTEGV